MFEVRVIVCSMVVGVCSSSIRSSSFYSINRVRTIVFFVRLKRLAFVSYHFHLFRFVFHPSTHTHVAGSVVCGLCFLFVSLFHSLLLIYDALFAAFFYFFVCSASYFMIKSFVFPSTLYCLSLRSLL